MKIVLTDEDVDHSGPFVHITAFEDGEKFVDALVREEMLDGLGDRFLEEVSES